MIGFGQALLLVFVTVVVANLLISFGVELCYTCCSQRVVVVFYLQFTSSIKLRYAICILSKTGGVMF